MEVGILLLRLIIAFILVAHATQKLFGWFQGSGRPGATSLFERLGQHPAGRLVTVASTCELLCAASLITGFLTPLGAAIGAGAMLVAGLTLILLTGTFWNVTGGGEYPIFLSASIMVVGFTGAGPYSADAILGLPWGNLPAHWQFLVGVGAAALALLSAVVPVLNARSHLKSTAKPTTTQS